MQRETEKTCTRCQKPKRLSEFHRNSRCEDGRCSQCRECKNKERGKFKGHEQCPQCLHFRRIDLNMKCWVCNANDGLKQCSACSQLLPMLLCFNPQSKHKKDHYRKQCKMCVNGMKYGLPAGEYAKMLDAQEGRCAICGGANNKTRLLDVDHDHKTGKVRRLLCSNCNIGLGAFCDDILRMRTAIAYLKSFK